MEHRAPPEIGWWPASTNRNPKVLRYYNGQYWSRGVTPDSVSDTAGFHGSLIAPEYKGDIEWTDRWWLK